MTLFEDPAPRLSRFAPAGRSTGEELESELREVLDHPLTALLLEALDGLVLVLNAHRQVLAVNARVLEALDLADPGEAVGLRPGELLSCLHAEEGPDGCGTASACARCGAVLAILTAQAGPDPVSSECLLSTRRDGFWDSREYRVRVTPLQLGPHTFLILALQDISSEKRREVLERVFLHDLLNTLQGLRGWVELLQMQARTPEEAAVHLVTLSDQMLSEVRHQQMLVRAEAGELAPAMETCEAVALLAELAATLPRYRSAEGRTFEAIPPGAPFTLRTDPGLLFRVLLNMALNALEATPPGGRVRAWFEPDGPTFCIHNPGLIPPEVAERIFQRSFSTKAARGRGLGTYSMRLLGEGILGGRISFTTDAVHGTCFRFALPSASQAAATQGDG